MQAVTRNTSLLAAALLWAAPVSAQSFKVAKYSIGGDGGTDYLTAEPGTGRVFVSRGTHVMVVDGPTGKVLGDIGDTPRMHGIAFSAKANHGFTTNAGDSTLRSEERRVGKECRSGWGPGRYKKKIE